MAVKKISVALDEHVEARARRAAEEAGLSLSAWLSRAAEDRAAIDEGLAAVREVEAEIGPFTEEERRKADEVLDRHGIVSRP